MTAHNATGPGSSTTAQDVAPVPPEATLAASLWRAGRIALQVGLPILLLWLAWREVHALDFRRVRAALAEADSDLVALGVGVAFLALVVMGLYDAVAFPRGASGALGFGRRWLLGAVLFGWTNFVSMGPIGGPVLRLLAYRRFGLTGAEITRGFVGHYIGSATGLAAWMIAAWAPGPSGPVAVGARVVLALTAAMALPMLAGRVVVPLLRRRSVGVKLERLPLAWLGLISFFDWGLTLVSFDLLIRAVGVEVGPVGAARTMFTGHFVGIASMLPGGLGSADAVWFKGLALLGEPRAAAVAAVVVFRAGFYLAPWLASIGVIYAALLTHSERLRLWQRRVVAGAVMLNAILLLLSAATPAIRNRLDAIARLVPLGAIEASHILATVAASLMLFLVRGLLRGYRGAYYFTLALLAASALAHPLKGGDIEESIASAALLILLFGVRGAFTRRGRVPVGWELTLAAGVGSLAFFLVVGFAVFERIPYRPDLWSTFAERAEASRFLRAAVVLAVVALAMMMRQAMRPARLWVTPSEDEIARAEAFARQRANTADALLVGGGDKGVWLWEPTPGAPAGLALYQRYGDKLIVFKDPALAPGGEPAKLIDAFLHFADTLDVDVVFALISSEWMSRLHDFGFQFLKVNEEAVVPLAGFTLEGGRNAGFRRLLRDMDKIGATFEIIEPPFDAATVDRLRAVSDAWLESKGGREMQFSACYFSPAYIQRNPVAVARDATGAIVAFANILATRIGGPATLDFMRFAPGAADNVMDFIIIRTMQVLSQRGFSTFSLGGAPLSDVGVWRGSRLVERLLHFFSTRAERIYNYQGLVRYKSKFHPEWQPRYLAYQQPWEWASSLLAYARLVKASRREDRRRIAAARAGSPCDEA